MSDQYEQLARFFVLSSLMSNEDLSDNPNGIDQSKDAPWSYYYKWASYRNPKENIHYDAGCEAKTIRELAEQWYPEIVAHRKNWPKSDRDWRERNA